MIAIELAPVPVAPEIKPTELPPGPQQAEAEPEPDPVQSRSRRSNCRRTREGRGDRGGDAAAETHRKTEGKEAETTARKPCQRAKHCRPAGRTRGSTGAGRLLARRQRGAELEVAAGRHSSSATSVTPPTRNRAASTALRNLPSASTAAAASTMRGLCAAPDQPCLTAKRWRCSSAQRPCRRRRRKSAARKSQSSCRSATIFVDPRAAPSPAVRKRCLAKP